ncbi:MAG: FAD/NAD(P)-binding protein [Acidobacteriota bacterium]|nr:FAD/NAD(P)-binding protein [Acidobacteriota bacterium]
MTGHPSPVPDIDTAPSIAFIGLGPKGLYAFERLIAKLHRRSSQKPVTLHIWEPRARLGVSLPYDLDQPPYLRMNFANRWVSARAPEAPSLPTPPPALVPWLEQHHPALADADDFAPRCVVGEYLHSVFEAALSDLPEAVRVEHHPEKAVDLRLAQLQPGRLESGTSPMRSRWQVVGASGGRVEVDQVLISVGHDARPRPSLGEDGAGLIPAVFPVDRWLTEEAVPPGSDVAMRGFALTWIDATLALFEGRGGRFESVDDGPRLRYRPGSGEVRTIFPFSRTGRPLLAKPDGHRVPHRGDLDEVWEEGRRRIAELELDGESATAAILRQVAASAAQALERAEPQQPELSADRPQTMIQLVARRCAEPPPRLAPQEVEQEMRHAWEVAVGRRPLDHWWALGQAWRGLYPALVDSISHRGLPTAAWPSFWRLSREMERIAFGPPAINVAKILALLDAGRIDLSFVQNPTVSFADGLPCLIHGSRQQTVDRLVHAVLRPPGAEPGPDSLLGGLLTAGHARQLEGTDGIEITRSAQCIGDDGRPTPGLSVLGRATEGCVLGNDTLSRTLHHHPEAWAARVVAWLVNRLAEV